ncbi:cytochrome o ubiquinol oxidase subunit III [Alteromonas pelagimontana]|uniref:Cytochrome bo(3) ubiquinol oxidase subunit 3 n=1 Tax=Alteromonas pelagimontana TaxID=1858656 RepID=A0A6M4MGP0_9ALTE|nr:cytochrome c oxidase subunit 3 [Alteromonas pelagimontana]QJR82361.1 cytochrome o ubiquinol oxidase subunit III [Alteromonas pelagimontana]
MSTGSRHPGLNLGEGHGSADERAEIAMFGFWIFLMSDFITFGLVFAVYGTAMGATAGGPTAKDLFEFKSVCLQTAVLLFSSLTCGMVSMSLKHQHSDNQQHSIFFLVFWILVTTLLGMVFIGLEYRDFSTMAEKGGIPSRSGWLTSYYALVGLHGLHMIAGCLWALVLVVQALQFGLEDKVKTRLMRWSLYWHFLDIVWVGIFSGVFLGGFI